MNNGWPMKRMGEVCENLDSKRVPITKNKRIAGQCPYYGASGVVDHVNDYIFDEDLLLVSEDGANLLARTYPIAFSVAGKVWVNNRVNDTSRIAACDRATFCRHAATICREMPISVLRDLDRRYSPSVLREPVLGSPHKSSRERRSPHREFWKL